MSKLLRFHRENDYCFVTSATYKRQDYLKDNYPLLSKSINKYSLRLNFSLIAFVILNDHFHALFDCKENNLSDIMKRIKLSFSKSYRNLLKCNSGFIWQHRYYDHIIRDQNDMNRHIDYIHYNPVKHGYVKSPFNWEYSSIHEFMDYYPEDWGLQNYKDRDMNFGE